MISSRTQALTGFLVAFGIACWYQIKAKANLSAVGVEVCRRPSVGRGSAPPWSKRCYTERGWRYRKIAFVFEAVTLVTLFNWLRIFSHR